MNCMVENSMRCYCSYHQEDFDVLLPGAELAYNSAVSEDLEMTSFEVNCDDIWCLLRTYQMNLCLNLRKDSKLHWMKPNLHMDLQILIRAQDLGLNTSLIPINQAIKHGLNKLYLKIHIRNVNSLKNCRQTDLVLSLCWS